MNKLEYQLHRPVMQILASVTVLAFFIICRLNIDSFTSSAASSPAEVHMKPCWTMLVRSVFYSGYPHI